MLNTRAFPLLPLALGLWLGMPLACSDGPDFGGDGLGYTTGGSSSGGGNGSAAGGTDASGGTPSSTGSGGSGTPPTQVVCTPGCEDVPRSSESCADAKSWGFCGQSWFDNCKKTCGSCDGSEEEVCVEVPVEVTGGSGSGSGGSQGKSDITPVPASSPTGWASRYWDCCKQHCSWPENSPGNTAVSCDGSDNNISDDSAGSACSGGSAHTCWSMAPWAVSDNLAYGYAAVPPGGACGKCYQLDFTGSGHNDAGDAGSKSLSGKTMIVQATNIGHDVNGGQFDLLIHGGGVGAFNACSAQWGQNDLGAQYGGFLTTCNGSASCVRTKCNSVFAGKKELLDGCLFLTDWMGAANNPNFRYAEVTCPAAIEQTSGMHD